MITLDHGKLGIPGDVDHSGRNKVSLTYGDVMVVVESEMTSQSIEITEHWLDRETGGYDIKAIYFCEGTDTKDYDKHEAEVYQKAKDKIREIIKAESDRQIKRLERMIKRALDAKDERPLAL